VDSSWRVLNVWISHRDVCFQNSNMQAEGVARQKIAVLEKSCRDLQMAKLEGDRVRQDLELQLYREREKGGNAKTTEELKTMITALQDRLSSLQEQVKLNKVTSCCEAVCIRSDDWPDWLALLPLSTRLLRTDCPLRPSLSWMPKSERIPRS